MENTSPAKKKEDPGWVIKTKLYYLFPALVIIIAGISFIMSFGEPFTPFRIIWLILNVLVLGYGILQCVLLSRFYKKYDELDKSGSLNDEVKEFISQQIGCIPIFMISFLNFSASDSSGEITALKIIGLVAYALLLILGFYVTKKMFTGIDRKMSNT